MVHTSIPYHTYIDACTVAHPHDVMIEQKINYVTKTNYVASLNYVMHVTYAQYSDHGLRNDCLLTTFCLYPYKKNTMISRI